MSFSPPNININVPHGLDITSPSPSTDTTLRSALSTPVLVLSAAVSNYFSQDRGESDNTLMASIADQHSMIASVSTCPNQLAMPMAGNKRPFPGFLDASTPSLVHRTHVRSTLDASYATESSWLAYPGALDGLSDRQGEHLKFGTANFVDPHEFLALQQEVRSQRNIIEHQDVMMQRLAQSAHDTELRIEAKLGQFQTSISKIEADAAAAQAQVQKHKSTTSHKAERTTSFNVFIREIMICLVGLSPGDSEEEFGEKIPHALPPGMPRRTRDDGSLIHNPDWLKDIKQSVNKAYLDAVVKLSIQNNDEQAEKDCFEARLMTHTNLKKVAVGYFHNLRALYKRQNDVIARERAKMQQIKSRRNLRKSRKALRRKDAAPEIDELLGFQQVKSADLMVTDYMSSELSSDTAGDASGVDETGTAGGTGEWHRVTLEWRSPSLRRMLYAADKLVWQARKGKGTVRKQAAKYNYAPDIIRNRPPSAVNSRGDEVAPPMQFAVSKRWLNSYIGSDGAAFVPAPDGEAIAGEIPDSMLVVKDLESVQAQEAEESEQMREPDGGNDGDDEA